MCTSIRKKKKSTQIIYLSADKEQRYKKKKIDLYRHGKLNMVISIYMNAPLVSQTLTLIYKVHELEITDVCVDIHSISTDPCG